MNKEINFESLLRKYDPPDGGVQGLRDKLERLDRKSGFFSILQIAFASSIVAVILLAVLLVPGLLKPKSNLFANLVKKSDNPVFIKYGYIKKNNEAVSIPDSAKTHLAALRVETSNKNVKFYLIESISNDTYEEKTEDSDINNPI